MKNFALLAMLAVAAASQAQVTAAPLGTWGFNGDGWWAPGENGITYLTTDSNQRSLAFNPATGNVLLGNGLGVSILDGSTGVRTGFFNMAGVSGGARTFNTVMATTDGQVFGTNLSSSSNSTSPFKVYRWANEAAGVAGTLSNTFNVVTGTTARLGDATDITGSGNSVQIVGGKGTGGADLVGYYSLAFDGTNLTPTNNVVTGSGNGSYRLGIAYDTAGNVVGKQTGGTAATSPYRIANGSTLAGSWTPASGGEFTVDFVSLNGFTLMATVDANSSAVRIYDVTGLSGNQTLAAPVLTLNSTTGFNSNGNAVGDIAFGAVSGNSVTLYALNTNNGIQAFTITAVPEPASMIALGAGLLALARRRRSK
ncbi:MAG: PEP-CTERM sorting domain-containing protein [Armatimonadota bacterium]|jgi:hypothetical protein|nr:PEP-CTERM sorting domain-containing protein [Fimbriimonadaceae bacterium]MCZ8139035.1 PEP-CTERM sorting domain-containing protein [Fimbriimonadaceae bacterium]